MLLLPPLHLQEGLEPVESLYPLWLFIFMLRADIFSRMPLFLFYTFMVGSIQIKICEMLQMVSLKCLEMAAQVVLH
jgi:hypothetical protein